MTTYIVGTPIDEMFFSIFCENVVVKLDENVAVVYFVEMTAFVVDCGCKFECGCKLDYDYVYIHWKIII
jgi:hypothetical protein